ncbi:phosphoserine phosphatase SerB [Sphingomicrobium nitratireducens]|uniref:phosphoserine phosphatase SerB n=1 Tax=Sphingomicrobium nitratireducens TaxID=2964666 RepID=UPI00223EA63C
MTIATLIAAERLEESLAEAERRLARAGIGLRGIRALSGEAADLSTLAEAPHELRDALGAIEGADLIVQREGRRPPALFVADMDSTMIGQECIDELADMAGVGEKVADITERAMQGELDFEGALRARLALLEGLREDAIATCLAERIRPNPGAAELVAGLKAAGARCVLVSGGFTAFAQPIADLLGFDRVVANVLAVEGGRLTGDVVGDIVGRARKEAVLREEAGEALAHSVAIGDGANDLAMLEAAGLGIAYRAKPVVAAAADARLDHHPLGSLLYAFGLKG